MDINVKHFSEFLANNIEMPTVCIPPNSEGKTKQEQWEMFITAWNKLDKKNEFDDLILNLALKTRTLMEDLDDGSINPPEGC